MSSTRQHSGLWVAFFGTDGAGKSTIIDDLEVSLSPFHAVIHRYHLRPHFGKKWQPSPPVTDPHAQPPRGWLLSAMKLLYWLVDYWFGYVRNIQPAIKAGGLVLFDRYCQDILIDPRRYRLPDSALGVAGALSRAVPKPDLLILLDAPPAVLQQRKVEVTYGECERQRQSYLRLFDSLPNGVVVDATGTREQVASAVREPDYRLRTKPPIRRS